MQQRVNAAEAVKALRPSVRAFWKLYGARFNSWWQSQDVASRRAFILEYTRGMAESTDDAHYTEADGTRVDASGHLLMLPELTVRQLSEDANHLPTLFERRARHAQQLEQLEQERGVVMFQGDEEERDLEWMSRVHARGMLQQEHPGEVMILLGDHAGQCFKVSAAGKRDQRMQDLLARGVAVEADVVRATLRRQFYLLSSLTVIADAFRQDVLGKRGSKHAVQALGCANCAVRQAEGGRPLKLCAKCGVVAYCGRECQLAHWRAGHKQECAAVLEGKADGGGGGRAAAEAASDAHSSSGAAGVQRGAPGHSSTAGGGGGGEAAGSTAAGGGSGGAAGCADAARGSLGSRGSSEGGSAAGSAAVDEAIAKMEDLQVD